jgi:hypothetical protein
MRVFLCYDSEQRDLAQRVALALAGAGIEVFFDRDDLPPGVQPGDSQRHPSQ